MKRDMDEIDVNNYNKYTFKALSSNMDIRFITNVWTSVLIFIYLQNWANDE